MKFHLKNKFYGFKETNFETISEIIDQEKNKSLKTTTHFILINYQEEPLSCLMDCQAETLRNYWFHYSYLCQKAGL